jgi:hypothetical protein
MNFLKWLGAGLIAGLLGAFVWAGISYAINYEIGYVAWAIGGLVGVAVRFAAGNEQEGAGPGVVAAGTSIGAVLLGKYLAVHFLVANVLAANPPPEITADDMMMQTAHKIVLEKQSKGEQLVWPEGKNFLTAEGPADFPPGVWQEANTKWKAIPADEQQKIMAAEKKEMMSELEELKNQAFFQSFGIFDALWFFLAAATAYRLGAGNTSDE